MPMTTTSPTTPPSLDTLVQDMYGLFGEEKINLNEEFLAQFSSELTELIRQRFLRDDSVRGLRMSNIGRPDRQLWYDINWTGEVEPLPPATLIKFMYGDVLEHLMLLLARQAGHTVEMEQMEVELDGIKGHPDAVIDGVVVDVKSASTYAFQKFQSGSLLEEGNDPFGYVAQLAGYTEAINPDADGAFLAVDKTLGKICTLVIPNDVLKQFQVRERIVHIKEVVAHDTPPPRCYEPKAEGKSGNFVLATGCSYCNHKFHCWSDANNGTGLRTFGYSTGPKYFTHVEREPRVVEGGEF